MAIQQACAECGTKLRAKDEAAGKRVKCPTCGGVNTLRSAGAQVEEDEFLEESPAPLPQRGKSKSGGSKPAASRQKGKGKSASRKQGLGVGAIIAMALSGLVVVGGTGWGIVYLAQSATQGEGKQGTATAAAKPEKISRKQKDFFGSHDTATEGRTTSEWFALIKEYRVEQNPMKRVLQRNRVGDAANFLGADRAAFPIVLEALTDQHLVDTARKILAKFGPTERPYFQDLIAGVKHQNLEAQVTCVKLLELYPESAGQIVPLLKEMVASVDPQQERLKVTACGTLGAMGDAGIPVLFEMFQAGNDAVRGQVLYVLRPVPDAVPLLLDAQASPVLAKRANELLAGYSATAKPSFAAVVAGLDHAEQAARSWAVRLMALDPSQATAIIAALQPRLAKTEADGWPPALQHEVLLTLAACGAPAIPLLKEQLQSPDESRQRDVISVIPKMGDAGAPLVRELAVALTTMPQYKEVLVSSLEQAAAAAHQAVDLLVEQLNTEADQTLRDRLAAVLAAAGDGGRKAAEQLAAAEKIGVRLSAITGLQRAGADIKPHAEWLETIDYTGPKDLRGAAHAVLKAAKILPPPPAEAMESLEKVTYAVLSKRLAGAARQNVPGTIDFTAGGKGVRVVGKAEYHGDGGLFVKEQQSRTNQQVKIDPNSAESQGGKFVAKNVEVGHSDVLWEFVWPQERCKGAFSGGTRVGPWVHSYENGKVWVQGMYANNQRSGHFEVFDPEGKKLWSGVYRAGELVDAIDQTRVVD